MPHDRNNQVLNVGDRVALIGTIKDITSDQPTYCNIQFLTEVGMAPEQPGQEFALSARMVDLLDRAKPIGQIAYEAYADVRNWKTFNGDPMPQWADTLPDIRSGWNVAGDAARNAVFPIIIMPPPQPTQADPAPIVAPPPMPEGLRSIEPESDRL